MSSFLDTAITLTGQGFDIERQLLYPPDITCKLLKIDGDLTPYSVVKEITSGWKCEFSDYRNRFVLEIATIETDFRTTVKTATHVALGVDIFQIDDGDTVPPIGNQFSWKFFCKQTGEVFEN